MLIGLISDTHGLLRPEVLDAFSRVDHIIHAGDVGSEELLIELEAIAPVTAVWGNTDDWEMRDRLPEIGHITLDSLAFKVLHGHQHGGPTAAQMARDHQDADLVLFGHSHHPEVHRSDRTLAVNPGSAGPARLKLPVTVALANTSDGRIDIEMIELVSR